MPASPFARPRRAILAAALAVLALALILAGALGIAERLSAALGPACHRLLPRLPGPSGLPRPPTPWRLTSCLGRR